MAVRKSKNGTWIADVSSGTNPITLIQRRIVRKGFGSRAILKKRRTKREKFWRKNNNRYALSIVKRRG